MADADEVSDGMGEREDMKTGAVEVLRLCGGFLLALGVGVLFLATRSGSDLPDFLGWAALVQGLFTAPFFFALAALLEGFSWLLEEVRTIRDEVAGSPNYLKGDPVDEAT